MKCKCFNLPTIACVLTALLLGGLTLGPFMHETDQAWLLDGGAAIATGHLEIARAEFNFDKQFISYLLPGALFALMPRPFDPDRLVLAGNIFSFVFFWGAMMCGFARSSRRLPLTLALPVILTPAFLVHSPFYASAFISGAFIILLALFLEKNKNGRLQGAVAFTLAFCAVGARADAMFLLPLLAMLHSRQRTFASVLFSPVTWLMAAGGLTAVGVGRASYLDLIINFAPQIFRLKQYLVFIAIGLGGATMLMAVALHAVWRARRATRCQVWLAFLGMGLILPMGYYSFQLLSPRHCIVGALSILVFICSRKGRAIFQIYFQQNYFAVTTKIILLLAAVAPIFLGANFSDVRHAKPTLIQPTLFPSPAGVCPAGAYLGHALNFRQAAGFVDHNQAIWWAAKNTRYESNAAGVMPLISTPVESYLIFAMRLQNGRPQKISLDPAALPPEFYMESRSLMRFQFIWPRSALPPADFFPKVTLSPATTVNRQGITILRGQINGSGLVEGLPAVLWLFNELFGPDEFRLENNFSLEKIPAAWKGKRLVLASRAEFRVTFPAGVNQQTVSNALLGAWHYCEIKPLHGGEAVMVEGAATAEILAGISAFPDWMSLGKLRVSAPALAGKSPDDGAQ